MNSKGQQRVNKVTSASLGYPLSVFNKKFYSQHRITDMANGSSHQAVSWTIESPLIARPIHVTGVYVSPSNGEIEKFFHTLTQEDHYPAEDIHIYSGDFNAGVTDEIEAHVTTQEGHAIPPRFGDCHRRHMPVPPAADPITNARISSPQRGRLEG